jgi:1-phosphofructokinase family hexose kinase
MGRMYLTVTANSSLDRIVFLEEFIPGKTMRTGNYLDSIGGKGLSIALAFIAGYSGKLLNQLLDKAGIHSDLIWVEGETRISHIIVETAHRRHSHIITPGFEVSDENCEEFTKRFQSYLPQADWVIIAGTLPAGAPRDFYADLCHLAQQAGKKVLVDCFGPPANDAIRAAPTIMKMNRHEMEVTFGLPADNLQEIHHSAEAIRSKFGLENFVVTCGSEGIVVVTKQGSWRAFGPRQVEVNGTGAGEAVSAVLPWRLDQGDTWPAALVWAAAAGSATVLTRGSGECRQVDVMRLLPDIQVINL